MGKICLEPHTWWELGPGCPRENETGAMLPTLNASLPSYPPGNKER